MQPKTKLYVLAAVAALVLSLRWWLGREDEGAAAADAKSVATSGQATPGSDSAPLVKPRRGSDIDVSTAPRATVTGTVRDGGARPIAGAQVCAKLRDRDLANTDRHPPECTTTAADGSYRLAGLLGAQHELHASARGYLPMRHKSRRGLQKRLETRMDLQPGSTRDGIDFVLEEGGVEVAGIVKDIAGGEIEGAWVSAGSGPWGQSGTTFGRSDEEGRFSLWVAPPSSRVAAFAEGYAQGSRSAAIPGSFVEIFLTPESVVLGKVVWADSGKPVAGAKVVAGGGPMFTFGPATDESAFSGEDGSFRLEGLGPGAYKIHASSDELTGTAAEKVHVGLGQTSDPVVVRVHPAFAVRGTVLIDAKTPCSQATVSLQGKENKDERRGSAKGHDDGSILIQGVLPGTYEVTVSCDGFVSEDTYPDLVVADASLEGQTWTVHAGQTIRGVVLDAEGRPVEGASVSARGKATTDPRARLGRGWAERTEPDGSFVVEGLLPGTYELRPSHADHPSPHDPLEVEVPAGQDIADITLTLLAAGEIQGIVRDEKGVAVAGVSVQLDGPRWSNSTTNDEGRFVMSAIVVGEHRITAQRGWSETMRAPGASDDDEAGKRVEVRAGETTEVELVVESQNGRITGRVVGEGGEPVADAFVEAVRESDSATKSEGGDRASARWGSWSRQPTLTDEDGRFELTELAEQGVYTVYANRKGGGEALGEHVKAGSDVELAIGETGVLAGVVQIEGGGTPQRFRIIASARVAGVYESDSFLRTDGKWRLTNLPPGKFEIVVEASEGTAKTEVELAAGAEVTDVPLVLTPRVELRGTLVDAETGEPVPGLKVRVGGEGGGFRFSDAGKADQEDVSDAQGRFVVEDAPTGKISVIIMAPGFTRDEYGYNWLRRRVAAEPRVQDLGRLELLRDRLGRGDEPGDLGFKTKDPEPDAEPEDVRYVIAFVRPGSPAAAAELQVGQEIVTVDGQDVRGENSVRYDKLTRVKAGTKVKLGVLDGGETRAVTVTAGPPV